MLSFGTLVDESRPGTAMQADAEATAVASPKSRPPSSGRRATALSQESLPSVTEESELDTGSPPVTGIAAVQPALVGGCHHVSHFFHACLFSFSLIPKYSRHHCLAAIPWSPQLKLPSLLKIADLVRQGTHKNS